MYDLSPNRTTDPSIKHWAVVESGGGGWCPVQHWGTFTNGWRFYFRFRSNCARLNVAPPGDGMADVPMPHPDWTNEGFNEALAAGEPYAVPMHWGPVGRADEVYPGDPLIGFFQTEDDLFTTFATCFEQVKEEIGLGDMVCPKCKAGTHDSCLGGTWCDCQHKVPSVPAGPPPAGDGQ
jgi:hypothetical protein